jgi:hypothetical protein
VSLQRRSLRLCEMTVDRAPWTGTITAPIFSSPIEIRHRVAQAIGKASYPWPSARLLPMLPHGGTEKLVCSRLFRQVFVSLRSFSLESAFSEITGGYYLARSMFLQLKCVHLVPAKAPLPEESIFNRNKATAERRQTTHKAQHKE